MLLLVVVELDPVAADVGVLVVVLGAAVGLDVCLLWNSAFFLCFPLVILARS
jgi:hypothetical protein